VRALPGASTAGYRALSSDLDTALRRLLGREAGTS